VRDTSVIEVINEKIHAMSIMLLYTVTPSPPPAVPYPVAANFRHSSDVACSVIISV